MQLEPLVSKLAFSFCLIISVISFTSLIFPRILVEITNENLDNSINYFEFGGWAFPIIIVNILFFILYFFYKKKKLPLFIREKIQFLNRNDISKNVAFVLLLVLFSTYIIFTLDEFGREEFELGDYSSSAEAAKNFEFNEKVFGNHFRYLILHISYLLFDNLRILPFIASMSLLLLTYFITLEITKKRIAGIVAFLVLMQSNLFLIFDTTSTYENFWTAFYFLSLYLIFKKPVISPILSSISFVSSIISKALSLTFMPINFIAIVASDVSKRNKIMLVICYSALVTLIVIAFLTNNLAHTQKIEFNEINFISSLNEFGNSLRFDGIILLLFFPTLIILRTKTGLIRNKVNFIFAAIPIAILSQPLMYFVIGMTLQPYRFIPLIVFVAISIGMIFSKSKELDQ